MVALAGVAGAVPEAVAGWTGAEKLSTAQLPPGLYEPSSKHLIHALSGAGELRNVPGGCETEYAKPGPYQPKFFTREEFQIVTRIMQIILGEVDSVTLTQVAGWFDLWLHSAAGVREAARELESSHRALAVAFYGSEAVRELETADPQATVRAGLLAMGERLQELSGRGFLQSSKAEQVEVVRAASAARRDSALGKFFGLIRGEAIRGYYTSAAGLKELDYKGNAYYSECPGCDRSEGNNSAGNQAAEQVLNNEGTSYRISSRAAEK
jgi:hypothetical protein